MKEPTRNELSQADGAAASVLWPMGAVTRRTGIGEHTLRAWERRFDFPRPTRLPSGHRRYTADQVQHLVLIGMALDRGYRAGDVVPMARGELEELLAGCGAFDDRTAGMTAEVIDGFLAAIVRLDRDELITSLRRDAAVLGVGHFLRERVAPLLDAVGEAWARNVLEVRHEHFFSEILEDQLRVLRVPLETGLSGRPVVLASLPEELHALGLQMAALMIAAGGRNVRLLGECLPVEEIARAAAAIDAAAVGLSISVHAPPEVTAEHVVALYRQVAPGTQVWIGGGGAAGLRDIPEEVRVFSDLDELERSVATLAD